MRVFYCRGVKPLAAIITARHYQPDQSANVGKSLERGLGGMSRSPNSLGQSGVNVIETLPSGYRLHTSGTYQPNDS